MVSPSCAGDFAHRVIAWQKQSGRHDLPWQQKGSARDPYRVWLSEIMLQQTQVATVIPYYRRFLARFPDLASLAAAPSEEVMALWSGLGYYARARNLQRAAQLIVAQWSGRFPRRAADIETLPGIGRSTAAAIAVFAFGARAAILDGNVKRVLARVFAIEGFPGEKAVEARLWALAESLLPKRHLVAYTQGLMDLGATLCARSRPRCGECPMASICVARQEARVAELPTPRAKRPCRSASSRCWCCAIAAAFSWSSARRKASGADCCRCRNCRTGNYRGSMRTRSRCPCCATPSRISASTSRRCCAKSVAAIRRGRRLAEPEEAGRGASAGADPEDSGETA